MVKNLYKKLYFSIFAIALILAQQTAVAQDISFIASGPGRVAQGSQFRISYTINAQGSSLRAPNFRGFNFLGGPSQSSSSSTQFINGQISQSVQYTYTYTLQAVNTGRYEIDEATIIVDGNTYKSNKLVIEVVAGNAPAQNRQQQQPQRQQQQTQAEPEISSKDVFVRASANKSTIYEGEEVILTYKLFTAIPIVQYGISKIPSSRGLWTTEYNNRNKQPQQRQEFIDGRNYTTVEVRRAFVYPQQSGNIRVEPLSIDVVGQIRRQQQQQRRGFWDSFFDDSFFGGGVQNVKKTIQSNAINLNVKKLPDNAPAEFMGAVGNYKVEAKIDRDNLPANEALKVEIIVSGKGNLKLLDIQDIKFPSNFETYDVKIIDNTKISESGVAGSITFEYIAIPRSEGRYKIETGNFVFFNPQSGKYESVKLPDFAVHVSKGVGGESVATNINQKELQYIGSDVRYIKIDSSGLIKNRKAFWGSTIFFSFLLAPLLLLILFIFIYKKRIKQLADVSNIRHRKAGKVARKRLRTAKKLMEEQNDEQFFEELSKALWNFAAHKFNISTSDLSTEKIIETMQEKEFKTELIDQLKEVLESCEFARFAPKVDKNALMKTNFDKAFDIIVKIDNEINI
ncbi:MAG: BatD family protein [Bacteroidales bacterium]|jgi:hypothetical protein|nr:protein BatD [Bacteroidales bacterium]